MSLNVLNIQERPREKRSLARNQLNLLLRIFCTTIKHVINTDNLLDIQIKTILIKLVKLGFKIERFN